jgi:hypothetical protein
VDAECACQIALNFTGLFLARTSRAIEWRTKRHRRQRGWLHWAFAMLAAPQILLARRARPGPCGDLTDLLSFASAAYALMPFDEVLMGAGCNSGRTTITAAKAPASAA